MTPGQCKNCDEGYTIETVVYFMKNGEFTWNINKQCYCCGGNYKDCPTCSKKEIPNQVVAVMDGNG